MNILFKLTHKMANMTDGKAEKSFCVLPWIQLHLMPDSSVTPCCISPDAKFGNVSKEKFEDIWNGTNFRNLRMDMLEGKLPEVCKHCYNNEKSGFSSYRLDMNRKFGKDKERILNDSSYMDGHADFNLKAIDIRFSNMCNFKCRGCGPQLSTAWYEDHIALNKPPFNIPKVRRVSADSPEFWNDFPKYLDEIEYIYFAGGEPLITKEHFDLLKYLISKGKTDIHLFYNTNLSTLNYEDKSIKKLWQEFKLVDLSVSIDDLGERGEYFRHGSNWQRIVNNLHEIKNLGKQSIQTFVNCTVSIMNVYYLPELHEYFVQEKLLTDNNLMLNVLQIPHELSITVLPLHVKNKVRHKLESYIEKCKENGHHAFAAHLQNTIRSMDEADNSHLMKTFFDYTRSVDKLRNENFEATFPELAELL